MVQQKQTLTSWASIIIIQWDRRYRDHYKTWAITAATRSLNEANAHSKGQLKVLIIGLLCFFSFSPLFNFPRLLWSSVHKKGGEAATPDRPLQHASSSTNDLVKRFAGHPHSLLVLVRGTATAGNVYMPRSPLLDPLVALVG